MSGAGSPSIHVDGTGLKVTIVAGQWHEEITDGLLAGGVDASCLPLPSPQGHDAFLVDIARFGPAVREFLDSL